MKRITVVIGTRPEAIKMAPIILQLKREGWAQVKVLATGQHRDLLQQVLTFFDIQPDFNLDVMEPNQSLSGLTARIVSEASAYLSGSSDLVLVQGDTTTAFGCALAAFYNGIPVGHVEAGLRTGDLLNPYPEEANRKLISTFSKWHFAPTDEARNNLLREGVAGSSVHLTGNTVIDALYMALERIPLRSEHKQPTVLITAHRRENFGRPIANICSALTHLARGFPDVDFLFPVHPNPNVRDVVMPALSDFPNVRLTRPLDYPEFVTAMRDAYLILTDSGGVQEEAPALGKPVLVLRSETERPEAVAAGVVRLVGTETQDIIDEVELLLTSKQAYGDMARGISPYGDGRSSERICHLLRSEYDFAR